MEEITEYIGAFAAGVLFCIAVWMLFLQCGGLFVEPESGILREFEVMYAL